MLKILHLNNFMSYTSGVARYIYQIVKNTSNIFEHEIVCLNGNAEELTKELKVKVTVLNYPRWLSLPGIYLFMLNHCKKNKFDIIHSHHRIFDTVSAMLPNSNFKSLTSVHSKVYGKKLFSYKADNLISNSDSITNHLVQYYKKSPSRIKRLENFVDKSNLKLSIEKDVLKKQLALSENKIIMFVGRFHREKGVDILVKAFNELHRTNKMISLLLIGEGEEKKMLKEYCSVNNLPVHILSPKKSIFDYYNIADIIVLPSRIDPFPYVMLDSGLMNKPFIGSNVDGIPELIKHRVNGLLFESENVNELSRSMQIILDDQVLAEQIARKLNDDVITNYYVEKVISTYIGFYNSLA